MAKFAVTMEGLSPLIDRVYSNLSCCDRQFSKNVSSSGFSYYVWMHAYGRIIAIKRHRIEETLEERQFLEFINPKVFPLPAPIEEYLRSIGNVRDPSGIEYRLTFPVWPNAQGHFGRVGPETFSHYMSLAAPIVVAQRIQQDLVYTANQAGQRAWDLPEELRPEAVNAGLPTRNLLGWSSAAWLNVEQQQLFESAGVDVNGIIPNKQKFQLNRALFMKISDFVKNADKNIKLGTSVHMSERGSQCQIPWLIRDVHEPAAFNRFEHYSEGSMSQRSYLNMDSSATAALITGFRVQKDAVGALRLYCPYDFNEYKEVPNNWHENRNNIFNHGNVEIWNRSTHRQPYTDRAPIRTNWVRRMIVTKSRD